jgi:hypothetical protein
MTTNQMVALFAAIVEGKPAPVKKPRKGKKEPRA